MADALKLKEHLVTNVPTPLRIKKLAGEYPETDYETKEPTGRNIYLYIFVGQDGKEFKFYADERQYEILKLFSPGDTVICTRGEKMNEESGKRWYPIDFTAPGDVQAIAAPQLRTNTAETRQERKQDTYEQEQKEKSIAICLQGFMQAFIINGLQWEVALQAAVEAREALLAKAKELSQ